MWSWSALLQYQCLQFLNTFKWQTCLWMGPGIQVDTTRHKWYCLFSRMVVHAILLKSLIKRLLVQFPELESLFSPPLHGLILSVNIESDWSVAMFTATGCHVDILSQVMQNPERFFCTTILVKSPHKQFSAVTYVWSWDFIGIFFTEEDGQRSVSGASWWNKSKYHGSAKSVMDCHANWQQSWQGGQAMPAKFGAKWHAPNWRYLTKCHGHNQININWGACSPIVCIGPQNA